MRTHVQSLMLLLLASIFAAIAVTYLSIIRAGGLGEGASLAILGGFIFPVLFLLGCSFNILFSGPMRLLPWIGMTVLYWEVPIELGLIGLFFLFPKTWGIFQRTLSIAFYLGIYHFTPEICHVIFWWTALVLSVMLCIYTLLPCILDLVKLCKRNCSGNF